MDTNQIKESSSCFLRGRLAVVEYSTIPEQRAEAALIKKELEQRAYKFQTPFGLSPAS